jgi:hypothetical protein
MIKLKHILFYFVVFQLNAQSLKLYEVRDLYKDAAQDKTKVAAFYDLLSSVEQKDGVALYAYKCAAIALKARHAKTIKGKKEGFKKGATHLEALIAEYPNKVEPRFIRLSIQENAPKILRYKSKIDEDKMFILKQYSNIKSKSLQKHIKDYILQSKSFNDKEKALILGS